MNVFELPHYFVVFHPGTGGNFISGLVRNIVDKTSNSLDISKVGSSHTTVLEKINKKDYLACGTFFYENNHFSSYDEKINFHKKRIQQLEITKPQVNWTHDFTNIPLYRTLFPNSKILTITQTSVEEKLISTIFQVHKNFLDDLAISPLDPELIIQRELKWKKWAGNIIIEIIGQSNIDLANKIIEDRKNPIYRDLVEYVTIYGRMHYYKLLQYVNNSPFEKDLINTVLYPVYNDSSKRYVIGNDYTFYTTDCVKMPYSCIIKNEPLAFLKSIQEFAGELNNIEKTYVLENFNRYYNSQNKQVLADPTSYFLELKVKAFNSVANLTV